MLTVKIERTDLFEKLIRQLKKKYPRIENDIDQFLDDLHEISDVGIPLGKNLYKARIKNSDANRGKSGGYRLISYLKLQDKKLTLIYIYSKTEMENISEQKLDDIVLKSFSEKK